MGTASMTAAASSAKTTTKKDAIIASLLSSRLSTQTNVMASSPTITSGAATSMAANFRKITFGSNSEESLYSIGGFRRNASYTGAGFFGDNITTNFALTAFSDATKRIILDVYSQFLEINFTAVSNSFHVRVDGEYVSAAIETETLAFRKYDFGSAKRRRIEIIGMGSTSAEFASIGVNVEHTAIVFKPEKLGVVGVIMTDSFGQSPGTFTRALADALGCDDIIGSGVGSTGYLKTGATAGTAPNFRMRLDHDVVQYKPDLVGFVGSVNDDGFTYQEVYTEALLLFKEAKLKLPDAVIFAAHTASSGADGESQNSLRNKAAKKAAASAAGIIWLDPTEFIATSDITTAPLSTTFKFNAAIGSTNVIMSEANSSNAKNSLVGSTILIGDMAAGTAEKRYIKSVAGSAGGIQCNFDAPLLQAFSTGDAINVIGGSYLIGTGSVSAPSGYGNADVLVNDGIHPTQPLGADTLGFVLANLLVTKLKN